MRGMGDLSDPSSICRGREMYNHHPNPITVFSQTEEVLTQHQKAAGPVGLCSCTDVA